MAKMKVFVTGSGGQLGQDLMLLLQGQDYEVLGCDRQEMDITDLDQCQEVIGAFAPDAVIHCAAHTAVDAAETDVDAAYLINATGSRNVALAAEKAGAKLVYISTDYVFDGMGFSLTMNMIIQILRVSTVSLNGLERSWSSLYRLNSLSYVPLGFMANTAITL